MGNIGSDYYEPDGGLDINEETKFLTIKTVSSGKESYDLFDYHATDPIGKSFTIKSSK